MACMLHVVARYIPFVILFVHICILWNRSLHVHVRTPEFSI
jgi:hypothetical protein